MKSIYSLAIKKLNPSEHKTSNNKNEFLIYPNPAQDQVNIYTTELESVYLYDNLGRLLSQISIPQSTSTAYFDIKHLNEGVYFIMDKERKTIRKFVKASTN